MKVLLHDKGWVPEHSAPGLGGGGDRCRGRRHRYGRGWGRAAWAARQRKRHGGGDRRDANGVGRLTRGAGGNRRADAPRPGSNPGDPLGHDARSGGAGAAGPGNGGAPAVCCYHPEISLMDTFWIYIYS